MTPRRGRASTRGGKVSEPKMRGEVVEGTVERAPRVRAGEGGRWQGGEPTEPRSGDAVPVVRPIIPGAAVRRPAGCNRRARMALAGASPRAGVVRDGADREIPRGVLGRNAEGCGGLAAAAGGGSSDAAATAAEHGRRTLGSCRCFIGRPRRPRQYTAERRDGDQCGMQVVATDGHDDVRGGERGSS
jgi:hypothetical protein